MHKIGLPIAIVLGTAAIVTTVGIALHDSPWHAPEPASAPGDAATSHAPAGDGAPAPVGEPQAARPATDAPIRPAAEPAPAVERGVDPAAAQAAAFRSRDGTITFRVPQPTDAEWSDYQEMLRHPSYRSSGAGSAGFALPYDPEWRSVVRGRRDAPPSDLVLAHAAPSVDALAEAVVAALAAERVDGLLEVCIDRREFLELCWPEFPQSRPYLKIPEAEAWSFQHAKNSEAIVATLRAHGGRERIVHSVVIGRSTPYRNFTLHENVVVHAVDVATGQREALDIASALVEREGRFKVFGYGE